MKKVFLRLVWALGMLVLPACSDGGPSGTPRESFTARCTVSREVMELSRQQYGALAERLRHPELPAEGEPLTCPTTGEAYTGALLLKCPKTGRPFVLLTTTAFDAASLSDPDVVSDLSPFGDNS